MITGGPVGRFRYKRSDYREHFRVNCGQNILKVNKSLVLFEQYKLFCTILQINYICKLYFHIP